MRLVVWNCNMALHKKIEKLQSLNADVAIVPESAIPEKVLGPEIDRSRSRFIWRGNNLNKGLAVVAGQNYFISSEIEFDQKQRIIFPVSVHGPVTFNLLAVWSNTDRDLPVRLRNVGPVLRSLESYAEFCKQSPLVIAGDFNHNVRWDKKGRADNHAEMVKKFESIGLVSAYHVDRSVEQGCEPEATIYWRNRTIDGPKYHIDYVFIPKEWVPRLVSVTLGSFDDWIGTGLSDHIPVIVDLDLP